MATSRDLPSFEVRKRNRRGWWRPVTDTGTLRRRRKLAAAWWTLGPSSQQQTCRRRGRYALSRTLSSICFYVSVMLLSRRWGSLTCNLQQYWTDLVLPGTAAPDLPSCQTLLRSPPVCQSGLLLLPASASTTLKNSAIPICTALPNIPPPATLFNLTLREVCAM